MKVGLLNSFWQEISQELKPEEIRVLCLLLSQQKGFKIHQSVMAKKMGMKQPNMVRTFNKLEKAGYLRKPDKLYSRMDGWHLTQKATKWKAGQHSAGYQLYAVDDICDTNVNNYEWLVRAYIAAYPEYSAVKDNLKFICKKLNIDVRTVAKYVSTIVAVPNENKTIITPIEKEEQVIYIEDIQASQAKKKLLYKPVDAFRF